LLTGAGRLDIHLKLDRCPDAPDSAAASLLASRQWTVRLRAAACAALIDVLGWRFGDLDESLTVRLAATDSVERLSALTHQALTAGSIQEVRF
jgi:hypothetical protein